MTTGRLSPLPSSSCCIACLFPNKSSRIKRVLRCFSWSLKSLNGDGLEGPVKASEYQSLVIQDFLDDLERVSSWKSTTAAPSWGHGFSGRKVRVLTAQLIRWENVAPALPPQEGSVKWKLPCGLCRRCGGFCLLAVAPT